MSLTFEDVLSFPEEAKVCFSSQPQLYQEFIDVMSKYASEEYELLTYVLNIWLFVPRLSHYFLIYYSHCLSNRGRPGQAGLV